MKNVFLIFLFLTLNGYIFGQYGFNVTQENYESLSNPISLNNNTPWDQSTLYTLNFDFDFGVDTATYNTIKVRAGGGIFFENDLFHFFLWVFSSLDAGFLLEDREQINYPSSISYVIDQGDNGKILKIQWENAGFRQLCASIDSPDDYVNFQIWLYEHTDKIEIRFGDSYTYEGSYGYPCHPRSTGLGLMYNFRDCYTVLSLKGPANYPTPGFPESLCFGPNEYRVLGTPISGIVYHIYRGELTTEEFTQPNIDIIPNPVVNELTIENKGLDINKIEVVDLTGKIIKVFNQNTNTIDVSELSVGVYFVNMHVNDKVISKKFIKQ